MGRPHKYAGSRLNARTSLAPARILELGAASAAVATGNRWDGKAGTYLSGSTTGGDLYEVRSGFGDKFKQLDFQVRVTPAGDRNEVATEITWYRTRQDVIFGFIPFGPKAMLGHHVYLQFIQDLAERLHAEDPSASVTVHKGEVQLPAAGRPAGAAAAVPSAPATALPGAAAVPATSPAMSSAGAARACAACATHAYDADVYCGGCGTLLPVTAAETTRTVR